MKYLFNTTLGCGFEDVGVVWQFEYDDGGIYNGEIEKVIYKGVDISGCLEVEQLDMLEARAELQYLKQVEEMYE
jgi:hypothetical protein